MVRKLITQLNTIVSSATEKAFKAHNHNKKSLFRAYTHEIDSASSNLSKEIVNETDLEFHQAKKIVELTNYKLHKDLGKFIDRHFDQLTLSHLASFVVDNLFQNIQSGMHASKIKFEEIEHDLNDARSRFHAELFQKHGLDLDTVVKNLGEHQKIELYKSLH